MSRQYGHGIRGGRVELTTREHCEQICRCHEELGISIDETMRVIREHAQDALTAGKKRQANAYQEFAQEVAR